MNNVYKNYQYKIGDYMKDLYWDLFKKTGKIEYYLKYREEIKNGKKK